jgi:hypothetical protein
MPFNGSVPLRMPSISLRCESYSSAGHCFLLVDAGRSRDGTTPQERRGRWWCVLRLGATLGTFGARAVEVTKTFSAEKTIVMRI